MAEKVGVYLDKTSLGQYLNLDDLAEKVQKKWKKLCTSVKIVDILSGDEGINAIQEDLKAETVDSVCIGGTSPRVDWEFLDFGSKVPQERVNLRELCIWAYQDPEGNEANQEQDPPEQLQAMALDYLNMGIAKLEKIEAPEPEIVESVKSVLVQGGGWSGLNSALSIAKAGYSVILVEKENELGGYARKLYKSFPLAYPYTQSQYPGIDELVQQVKNQDKITIYTSTRLESFSGQPGDFTASLKTSSGEEELQVGAMVVATGWEEQDKQYLEPLGYGKNKDVVTMLQFEEMAKKGEVVRPSDGKKPENVAFVLGFRDTLDQLSQEEQEQIEKKQQEKEAANNDEDAEEEEEETFQVNKTYKHLPYTSEITSLNALKQAGYVREFLPQSKAFIIYEHMTIPGVNEHYYKAAQDDTGIMMTKGEVESITASNDNKLLISARDTLIADNIEVEADMVVLPTGLVPTTALDPILQLSYRQGPSFPELELFDGFSDSNYICFPYETRRTGIYAAGSVHQPMTLAKSEVDAQGAALKAIQCLESVNRGMSVHPRSGDLSYPKFNFVRCTQCRRCTVECPFGALEEDEEGTPKPNIARCRRCGTCMGACPERVISFDNYGVGQISSMITQVSVPDEIEEGGPRILVLACENDAYPAMDMAAQRGNKWSPYVRIIPVRCLGSVNTIWIADAMGKGFDGALLLGCKYGDDYQCHFVKGSELCEGRMQNIGETLDRLGVELERVQQEEVAIDEYENIPNIINNFVDKILELGPNPFKGF